MSAPFVTQSLIHKERFVLTYSLEKLAIVSSILLGDVELNCANISSLASSRTIIAKNISQNIVRKSIGLVIFSSNAFVIAALNAFSIKED